MKDPSQEPVLGLYFDAEADILAAESSDIDDDSEPDLSARLKKKQPSNKSKFKYIPRNVDPMDSNPKPPVEYETEVPGSSTIIAMISQRRVDRVTPEQAWRTDACLPCGRDGHLSSSSLPVHKGSSGSSRKKDGGPQLELHKLPCNHVWCRECLARLFLFAKNNNTFNRLQCCNNEEEIPMRYFENIAEDGEQLPPKWEVQDTTGSEMFGGGAAAKVTGAASGSGSSEHHENGPALPSLRDWNPIRVVPRVEKDREIFLTKGDIASYKESLLEFNTLPRDRVYCRRKKTCGSFIPRRTLRKGQTTVACPKCGLEVCLRCRKNPASHSKTTYQTRCTAGPRRMEVVKNDRMLLSLARKKGWKRCPRCGMFVEKVKGGCPSVRCFCGRDFFYG